MLLTQESLKKHLHYDPETGLFRHRKPRSGCYPGQLAGAITVHGYRIINVGGSRYFASRLAWLYMTGEWPSEDIDHINGQQADDRWINIREATKSQNMRNTKLRSDNTSGSRGVSWNTRKQKWHVRVTVDGVDYHCGYFADFERAKTVRDYKARELHGAFARIDEASLNTEARVV